MKPVWQISVANRVVRKKIAPQAKGLVAHGAADGKRRRDLRPKKQVDCLRRQEATGVRSTAIALAAKAVGENHVDKFGNVPCTTEDPCVTSNARQNVPLLVVDTAAKDCVAHNSVISSLRCGIST